MTQQAIIDGFDHFLLDLDGVVYIGREAVPGSAEAIAELRRRGKQVRFLTNDPTRDPSFFAERLSRLGIPTPPSDVLPVAGAVLAYLEAQAADRVAGAGTRPCSYEAYVVGTPALKAYLRSGGIRIVEESDAERARAVVVGGSIDFDYHQLKLAGPRPFRRSTSWSAGETRPIQCPMGVGQELARSWLASSTWPDDRRCPWVSPSRGSSKQPPRRCRPAGGIAVIGDNLKSDIVGALRAGYASVLALSGHTDRHELERSEIRPDYVVERLFDVVDTAGTG
jgi:glycerol 3-phosphatase-2